MLTPSSIAALSDRLLAQCTVAQLDKCTVLSEPSSEPDARERQRERSSAEAHGQTCLSCGITLPSVESQRAHFKLDWHRLNVKRRAVGLPALSEEASNQLLLEDGSSVSGSDVDSDDERSSSAAGGRALHALSSEPKTTFAFTAGEKTRYFRVWSSVLYPDTSAAPRPSAVDLLQALRGVSAGHQSWAVIMSRGGHFAAAIFDLQSSATATGEDAASVQVHKTFHRYVTRQGQGGRQSSKDATGKYAKSSGSQLRRHNEAALERDVTELLASWAPQLDSCALVFVHAPASNAAPIFASGALLRDDARVRRIPFTTGRPTFRELKRCVRALLAVDEVDVTVREVPGSTAAPRGAQPARSDHARSANAATPARADCTPQVTSATPPDAIAQNGQAPEPSALHVAAAAGDEAGVRAALERGADPSVRDARGRTPYDVASCKVVRDCFRKFMAQHPEAWDYVAAHVPSPLTDEMQAAQDAKKAAKKARQRERERSSKAAQAAKRAQRGAAVVASHPVEDDVARAALEAAAEASRLNGGRAKTAANPAGPRAGSAADAAAKRRQLLAQAAEARQQALRSASSAQQLW